jgi:hypothetical protein
MQEARLVELEPGHAATLIESFDYGPEPEAAGVVGGALASLTGFFR